MNYTKEQLEEMIKSERWQVREAVAKQGYGLDKLINDKNYDVRIAVAEQGYGLDKLIFDEDKVVRRTAFNKLIELVEQGKVEITIKEK